MYTAVKRFEPSSYERKLSPSCVKECPKYRIRFLHLPVLCFTKLLSQLVAGQHAILYYTVLYCSSSSSSPSSPSPSSSSLSSFLTSYNDEKGVTTYLCKKGLPYFRKGRPYIWVVQTTVKYVAKMRRTMSALFKEARIKYKRQEKIPSHSVK